MTDRQKAIKEADKWHSQFTRLKDADFSGYNSCVTCGRIMQWQDLHCGHWRKRRYLSTRWEMRNTHPQCPSCNCTDDKADDKLRDYIEQKYGTAVMAEIFVRDDKMSTEEILDIAKQRKRIVQDMI